MTWAKKNEGSARPEGGREAPALGGGSGAARWFTPGVVHVTGVTL